MPMTDESVHHTHPWNASILHLYKCIFIHSGYHYLSFIVEAWIVELFFGFKTNIFQREKEEEESLHVYVTLHLEYMSSLTNILLIRVVNSNIWIL